MQYKRKSRVEHADRSTYAAVLVLGALIAAGIYMEITAL